MIETTQELAALLRGTWLEKAELSRLRRGQDELQITLGIDMPGFDAIEAWALLKQLMPRTGRYPLVIWRPNAEFYLKVPLDDHQPKPPARWFTVEPGTGRLVSAPPPPPTVPIDYLQRVLDKVDEVDPAPLSYQVASDVDVLRSWLPVDCDSLPHHPLNRVIGRFGAAPSMDTMRALASQGELRGFNDMERWLMQWEREQAGSDAAWATDASARHMDIAGGMANEATLVLLPTDQSWHALACHSWWGNHESPERVAYFLRRWQQRFGAELVCNYGTLLQFRVGRPPATPDEAFELALEHWIVASDTLVLPGVSMRDHTRALIGQRHWQLHSRP